MKSSQWLRECACVIAFATHLMLPTYAQMTTPGSFSVSEVGSASYSVPIGVPAGVGGIVPRLALTYSSQSGNGTLGVGWNLSGLSSISRCPASKLQDGVRGRVGYDLKDRYCLDGQRLIALVVGKDGSDMAEYRTEHDGLSKITSYGSAGSGSQGGPAYFVIKTKSGLTMTYGGTPDSAIEAQGQVVIRTWALNKVSDTVGNYMNIVYTEDNANGQYQPARIDYTGNANAGQAPINSVHFDYETRPDIVALYRAGSMIKNTQRMTRVWTTTTTGSGSATTTPEIGEVRIQYEASNSPATNRSRVSAIQTCDGPASGSTTKCLPAIKMTWSGGLPSITTVDGVLPWDFGNAQTYQLISGDFNGDGRNDFIEVLDGDYYVFLANDNGGFTGTHYSFPNGWKVGNPVTYRQMVGDFNGDGLTDFIEISGGNYYLMLSKGDGTFYSPSSTAYAFPNGWTFNDPHIPNRSFLAGDFNADGKTDLAVVTQNLSSNGVSGVGVVLYVLLNNGDGTFSGTFTDLSSTLLPYANKGYGCCNLTVSPAEVFVADFDGDHLPDIGMRYKGVLAGFALLHGNGDGTFLFSGQGLNAVNPPSSVVKESNGQINSLTLLPIDWNGDGLIEFAWAKWGANYQAVLNNAGANSSSFDVVTTPTPVTSVPPGYSSPATQSNVNSVLGMRFSDSVVSAYFHDGDVNGDGINDLVGLVRRHDAQYNELPPLMQVATSNLDGTFKLYNFDLPASVDLTFADVGVLSSQVFSGDFDGDGRLDILVVKKNHYTLIKSTGDQPDLLTKIETGVGLGAAINVTYKPLPQMGLAFVKDLVPALPQATVTPNLTVVSQVDMANGLGGVHTVTYRYGTPITEVGTGRGFLGFNWTEHTDVPSGLTARTYVRQDWPYIGQVDRTAEYTNSGSWSRLANGTPVLSNPGSYFKQTINNYGCLDISAPSASPLPACTVGTGKRYFVYPTTVTTSGQDLNGVTLPGSQTTQTMDGWGNALTVVNTTLNPDGSATNYSKTTTNTYANDITNWFLGRLLKSTVTAVSP